MSSHKKHSYALVGALLATASVAAACGSSGAKSNATNQSNATNPTTAAGAASGSATNAPIKIGMTSSNTGAFPVAGIQASGFMQRYFDKINSQGGVNGHQIDFKVLDDGATASRATANVQQLILQDHVQVVTSDGSATSVAIMPILKQNNIPYLFPQSFESALINPPQNGVYALFPLYPQQINTVVKYAYKKLGAGSAVIVRDDLPVWDSSTSAATQEVQAMGGKVTKVIQSTYTQSDWGSVVLQIQQAHPDYLILITSGPAAGGLLKAMSQQGVKPGKASLGIASELSQLTVKAAGGIPDNTFYGALPGTVAPGGASSASCQQLWPQEPMEIWGLEGCAQAAAIVQVFKDLGDNFSASAIDNLLNNHFGPFKTSYTGTFQSSPTHLLTNGIGIGTYVNNAVAPVGSGVQ
ncbi:MAG TPA: ABC transporter substrate-binding protein [Acidimicrobiales bacterium]|nr:ABC transporter substrate-binding protein [Acidimicrobiales bacterium]